MRKKVKKTAVAPTISPPEPGALNTVSLFATQGEARGSAIYIAITGN